MRQYRAKLLHPKLPGMDFSPAIAKRHAKKSDRLIEQLFDQASTDARAATPLKNITEGQHTAEQKSVVDRYQSPLLMPEWLICEAAENLDLTSWSILYQLAVKAQVNISNLSVRLRRLGLICLRDGDKTIYRSEDEWSGQTTLL